MQGMAAEVIQLLASPTDCRSLSPSTPACVRTARKDSSSIPWALTRNTTGNGPCSGKSRRSPAPGRSRAISSWASASNNWLESWPTSRNPSLPLAAYQPEWRAEIDRMRGRIEHERTPPGKDPLAIKTGAGGLVDAEFIAQVLCLAHGWQEPTPSARSKRARRRALPAPEAGEFIDPLQLAAKG
jgi:hypothetical protein